MIAVAPTTAPATADANNAHHSTAAQHSHPPSTGASERVRSPRPAVFLSEKLGKVAWPQGTVAAADTAEFLVRNEVLESLARLAEQLGMQGGADGTDLDEAADRCLKTMDAVWMEADAIRAVFVLEPGPRLGDGFRKAADLCALFPKLKAPVYLLSGPEAFLPLLAEVHRPVYRLMKKPLEERLRFLAWGKLKDEIESLGERVRYMKPEFLEGLAERFVLPGLSRPAQAELFAGPSASEPEE